MEFDEKVTAFACWICPLIKNNYDVYLQDEGDFEEEARPKSAQPSKVQLSHLK
jgi:hypothetical protein